MDQRTYQQILDLMASHNILTLATMRDDGYPQATTLQYANQGLILYFAADRNSRKIVNILLNDRVSVAIAREYADWRKIKGLSMAARARLLARPEEVAAALGTLAAKFPDYAHMLRPDDPNVVAVRVTPEWISLIDYAAELGHTELIPVESGELPPITRC